MCTLLLFKLFNNFFFFWFPSYSYILGSKGSVVVRGCTRLPPVWPRFKSRRRHYMWVEFSLALRGFSPGTPVFPSPHKLTFSNSNLTRNGRQRITFFVDVLPPNHYHYYHYYYMQITMQKNK